MLTIKEVSKSFKNQVVISNLNLEIKDGEIFGLLGKSGSGKSVMLKLLLEALKPDKGEILYNNQKISKFKNLFGYSSQDSSLYDDLTVQQNLAYFGSLFGVKKDLKERIDSLLYSLNLTEYKKKLTRNLSGGMRKRLDIACALIAQPKILLLDEPLANLDPLLREDIINIIRSINKKGITVVIASHLLTEIENLCNNIAIINKGQLIIQGNPSQLKESFSKSIIVTMTVYPQRYNHLLSYFKNKFNILQHSIEYNSLKLEIPIQQSIHKLLYDFLTAFNELKVSLLKIEFSYPSLETIFRKLLQDENT